MNLRPRRTFRVLGRLLLVLALAEALPILVCLWYQEGRAALAFLATSVLTGLLGGLMILVGEAGELYRREGILIVAGGWMLASLFGALPYLMTGVVETVPDAIFESASGFTTTGATIFNDIEAAGRGVLFWRSFTQWLGGMGIIVLFVALLPELGPGARFLYKLEVPGPTAETLHPRVTDTAAVLWRIYLYFSVALTTLLMLAGMDLYDALTHTFSTLSTGGFSPRGASVAAFQSPLIEVIIIVFMFLAGANFSLYYGLRRLGFRSLWLDAEFRIYLIGTCVVSCLVAWSLMKSPAWAMMEGEPYKHLGRALLDSFFQVSSILTTTGFGTADFDRWPPLARNLVVALMFVGGCAGSTAGGMKIMRLVVGMKSAFREVRMIFSPSTVLRIFVSGKAVPEAAVRSVGGFFILYIMSWAAGSLFLTVGGHELEVAASASIATLGNIGPGLGAAGPTQNFAFFAGWQKLMMVALMWIGRLEVYVIAALVTTGFWRG